MKHLAMRIVISLLLVSVLYVCAGAQTGGSGLQPEVQAFLQKHPEVVDQLKGLLARQLQQQGSAIDQQAISDAMLAARLQTDTAFRTSALQYLVGLGTISDEQARELNQQFSAANDTTTTASSQQAAEGAPGDEAQAAEAATPLTRERATAGGTKPI